MATFVNSYLFLAEYFSLVVLHSFVQRSSIFSFFLQFQLQRINATPSTVQDQVLVWCYDLVFFCYCFIGISWFGYWRRVLCRFCYYFPTVTLGTALEIKTQYIMWMFVFSVINFKKGLQRPPKAIWSLLKSTL